MAKDKDNGRRVVVVKESGSLLGKGLGLAAAAAGGWALARHLLGRPMLPAIPNITNMLGGLVEKVIGPTRFTSRPAAEVAKIAAGPTFQPTSGLAQFMRGQLSNQKSLWRYVMSDGRDPLTAGMRGTLDSLSGQNIAQIRRTRGPLAANMEIERQRKAARREARKRSLLGLGLINLDLGAAGESLFGG